MAALVTPKVAWLFNFDADRELAAPGYTPSHAVRAKMATLVPRLGSLVLPGDHIVDADTAPGSLAGTVGRAWCPTPRAVARLRQTGATVEGVPSLDVLTRVNSRAFSASLGQTLPGAAYVHDEAALREAVQGSPSETVCLKSAFSTSGSGQKRVPRGALPDGVLAWARRELASGLQVEPWVPRLGDFAVHGYVDANGRVELGSPTVQRIGDTGSWLASERAHEGDLGHDERLTLLEEGRTVGTALAAVGYAGPFNLDAFRYATQSGAAFQPRCEINARYTMGWAVGMGDRRPDRLPGSARL